MDVFIIIIDEIVYKKSCLKKILIKFPMTKDIILYTEVSSKFLSEFVFFQISLGVKIYVK